MPRRMSTRKVPAIASPPMKLCRPSPIRIRYVSGFLQLAVARLQWCQCRNCSSAKNTLKPTSSQTKKLLPLPYSANPAGIM